MASSGIVNGTKFGIYDGSTLIAYATSGSVSMNHSTRESSNKESSGWKEIMEGQRDWECSCEGMVAFLTLGGAAVAGKTVDELFTTYIATRGTLTVSFESSDTGDYKWSGTAYMSSLSIDAPNEESSTYSCSFTGTSALTQATVQHVATNGIINGTSFGVYANTGMLTMIGFSTSCAISISQDTRNTTTNATGSWVTRTIGNKDWEISTEGMVAFSTAASGGNSGSTGQLIHEIFENYLDDTSGTYNPRFLLVFSGAYATGDKYFQGYACISSLSIDASNQESATYSVSFVAAGPLEIITV